MGNPVLPSASPSAETHPSIQREGCLSSSFFGVQGSLAPRAGGRPGAGLVLGLHDPDSRGQRGPRLQCILRALAWPLWGWSSRLLSPQLRNGDSPKPMALELCKSKARLALGPHPKGLRA